MENDNRNCDCNNNNNNSMMLYNTVLNNVPEVNQPVALNNNWEMSENMCHCCNDDNMTRQDLLNQIKCYSFAITELAQYLDTHPDDEKALCLHNKYCRDYKDLTDKYQKVYGPLTINYPCNKWRWIEEPWPWEGGVN